jgi:hypothetical protein
MLIAKRNKTNLIAQLRQVVAGLAEHMAGETVVLFGKTWNVAELKQLIQNHIDELLAAQRIHKEWIATTGRLRAEFAASIEPAVTGIHHHVLGQYGEDPTMLVAFGFEPFKKPYRSVETKKAAAEKARATRKARGTLGKRQRLAIHGVVPPASEPAAGTPTEQSSG